VIEIFFELFAELAGVIIDLGLALFESGWDFNDRNPRDRR